MIVQEHVTVMQLRIVMAFAKVLQLRIAMVSARVHLLRIVMVMTPPSRMAAAPTAFQRVSDSRKLENQAGRAARIGVVTAKAQLMTSITEANARRREEWRIVPARA